MDWIGLLLLVVVVAGIIAVLVSLGRDTGGNPPYTVA